MDSADGTNQRHDKLHFFVSYTQNDKAWAEWIAWVLESDRWRTHLQAWDSKPGRNFVLEMQQAADTAERTLAVLSPSYLASEFTQSEWAQAFRKDPTGERGLLIPVRVHPCKSGALVGSLSYVDLVDLGEESAEKKLMSAVSSGREKPASRPRFPGSSITTKNSEETGGHERGPSEAGREREPPRHTDTAAKSPKTKPKTYAYLTIMVVCSLLMVLVGMTLFTWSPNREGTPSLSEQDTVESADATHSRPVETPPAALTREEVAAKITTPKPAKPSKARNVDAARAKRKGAPKINRAQPEASRPADHNRGDIDVTVQVRGSVRGGDNSNLTLIETDASKSRAKVKHEIKVGEDYVCTGNAKCTGSRTTK